MDRVFALSFKCSTSPSSFHIFFSFLSSHELKAPFLPSFHFLSNPQSCFLPPKEPGIL